MANVLIVLLLSAAVFAVAKGAHAPQTASSVCVYNDAAFVLNWKLRDVNSKSESGSSHSYPVWQTKCMSVPSAVGATPGDSLVPVVSAVWGKEITVGESLLFDPVNATQITYVCKGTTLDFSCAIQPPPPTAGDVAKWIGDFLLGFVEGLSTEIGFADCVKDINATYHDIKAVVDFFESGINTRVVPAIMKAFELLGGILKDLASAIESCVKSAASFVAKMKDVAGLLAGNVADVIKVVIDELVHIWHDRSELTEDCKATVTAWRAGDYKASGKAVGDIVGIIIAGL